MSFYNENTAQALDYVGSPKLIAPRNTKERLEIEIAQLKARLSELEELQKLLEENPMLERAITLMRHL